MKPSIQTLGHILYSPSQYVIPVFQRNYRWDLPELRKLWESLEEIQQPNKTGNHFMGFLVFMPGLAQPGQNTTFHVIDGQQRLTTLSLLLVALRNIARQRGFQDLADEIHQDYLVHPRKRGDEHYRVLPKERDHDNYVTAINGLEKSSGRIAAALVFFEDKLSSLGAGEEGRLVQIFNVMRQRFEFMCATLEAENAYSIFKSLNSTGVPLGPSDLICNFVFMHVLPDNHDQFDEECWAPLEQRFTLSDGTLNEDRLSRFFRDFLMTSGKYIGPGATFPTFEARYEATGFSPVELSETLNRFGEYYEIITGRRRDSSEAVTAALSGLNSLESSTTYPLLLKLFDMRSRGALDDSDLGRAISMLTGFILRRFICGESSRGYGQMFVRAIPSGSADPVEALRSYLVDRGWPDDHRFTGAFVDLPMYLRDYAKHILETIERHRGHKEQADLSKTEIEHIMPQTLNVDWRESLGDDAERIYADWLHKPGNLTLSAYNKELWNHGFNLKQLRYAHSNVTITRDIARCNQWGEDQIKERGKKLAEEAAAIWAGPDYS